jgi:hypothetical protein
MRIQHISNNHSLLGNFPIIDIEFDRFEQDKDLETTRHAAEMELFYHDNLDPQE